MWLWPPFSVLRWREARSLCPPATDAAAVNTHGPVTVGINPTGRPLASSLLDERECVVNAGGAAGRSPWSWGATTHAAR